MKATIRKQTQRLVTLSGKSCERCGITENLQRHHQTYTASDYVILCQGCHASEHSKDGSWGRGLKKTKFCVICGSEFTPNHSKRHKTCSSNCLSELGRRNARKRWEPESTDLGASETRSSRRSRSGSAGGSSRTRKDG